MLLKNNKHIKYFKYLINPYVLILIGFIIWMLFIDDNSFLFHQKLNHIIDEKKAEIEVYRAEISSDKKDIELLKNDDELENFARKEYYMKKENEEIYIIEYPNTKTNTDE